VGAEGSIDPTDDLNGEPASALRLGAIGERWIDRADQTLRQSNQHGGERMTRATDETSSHEVAVMCLPVS
jgi:hypothetical protein